MEPYFLIDKKQGETPLGALERLRAEKGIDTAVPMTYAGRLDPMAEGLLLILVGDECKKKDRYLGLDKEYEVEVLLGIGSDTGDVLGKLHVASDKLQVEATKKMINQEEIAKALESLIGKRKEKYPAFSSKPIGGKPLFAHARNSALESIDGFEMPEKEIEIYSIDLLDFQEKNGAELADKAIERIKKVHGDFRQPEIVQSWQRFKADESKNMFQIIQIKVSCSSGAYMRTLAEKIGHQLKTLALAWSIKRVKIGAFASDVAA